MDASAKSMRRWILRNFDGMKTYHEGRNPRRWILACQCLRQAIGSILTSEVISRSCRDYLVRASSAFVKLQMGMIQLYEHKFSKEEFNSLSSYPGAWMLESFTGIPLGPLNQILSTTTNDTNTEANSTCPLVKSTRRWILRNFDILRTYYEGNNPRGWILACQCVRQTCANLLTSKEISVECRDYLAAARTAFTYIQSGMMILYDHEIDEIELKAVSSFPHAWVLQSFTGISPDPLYDILNLHSNQIEEQGSGIETSEVVSSNTI